MNHRDHRKPWESSSGFGQIVNRDYGRGRFGFADVDLVFERRGSGPMGMPLLMIFEHKESGARVNPSQSMILQRLAMAMHQCVIGHQLDPQSGVFKITGHIDAAPGGRRETILVGVQSIERMLPRSNGHAIESWVVQGQDALFRWMDQRLGWTPTDRTWRGDS